MHTSARRRVRAHAQHSRDAVRTLDAVALIDVPAGCPIRARCPSNPTLREIAISHIEKYRT